MQKYFYSNLILLLFIFLFSFSTFSPSSWAQKKALVKYVSDTDQNLSISKILILDFVDNSGDIYGKPLTEEAKLFFERPHQWEVQTAPNEFKTEVLQQEELKKICTTKKFSSSLGAGAAVLSGRLISGPLGQQLKLRLSLCQDQKVLLIDNTDPVKDFSTDSLKKLLNQRLLSLIEKLPFQGIVLSRRGQDVTINMGQFQGLQSGDIINAIQIINMQRHPKQEFLVGHDKVLLGQISISKVDQFLSFGQITMEKEPGVIQASQKIKQDQFIQYSLKEDGTWLSIKDKLKGRSESDIAFGAKPTEWRSQEPPQYGAIQVALGVLQYNQNLSFSSAGSLSASNSLAPTLSASAELWLNDFWYFDLGLKQSAFSVSNEYSRSSPSSLNMSVSRYHLAGGYNFLLEENNFWGSKLRFLFGLAQFSAKSDRSSPQLFVSDQNFGGMYLGLTGDFPLSAETPWNFGFKLRYYVTNSSSDSDASGSSGIKINDFGFFTKYTGKKGYNYFAELNFEYYNSDFSGGSRSDRLSSTKHKITEILAGIEYLF